MRDEAQGPERVTEKDYVSATQGPNRDTETFYKATPAPGEVRDDRAAPPPSTATLNRADMGDRLTLRSRTADSPDASSNPLAAASGLPWLWILGGVAAISGMVVVGGAILLYLAFGGSGDAQPTSTEQQQEDKEWEGLKVKKGLR